MANGIAAFVWRRLMFRTTVIAITGSVGKSTTKECLAAILSGQGQTVKTMHNQNDMFGVPRTIFSMRPWHRYAVIEAGAGIPGYMRRFSRLLKPDIAIVLCVARTHTDVFPTLEDTAREKAELLRHLRRGGTAILNGDDARVRPMAARCQGNVVLFGQDATCDMVAENVDATWPGRLVFVARSQSCRTPVQTQLVGTHWVNTALAALAAAHACGVPLPTAARALASVPPFAGRMQPVALPNGAVAIRDEENASPDTYEAMLKVLREARAGRKVLVLSDISDKKTRPRNRLREIGRMAAELVDVALFVGEHARHAARAAVDAGMDPANCHTSISLERAAGLLRTETGPGDLVFVKGRMTHHLSRLVLAQFGEIGCWTTACRLKPLCDVCGQLRPAFDLRAALAYPHPPAPDPAGVG